MNCEGRAWVFGDNMNATQFLSGKYDPLVRAGNFAELATHLLEDTRPGFHGEVRPGDMVFAGNAFGTGKHLEGLIGVFKFLGIHAVFARSFAAGWERDSMNLGLPAMLCLDAGAVGQGDRVRVDLSQPVAHNLSTGGTFSIVPLPPAMLDLLAAGGLEPYTLRRLARSGRLPARATA